MIVGKFAYVVDMSPKIKILIKHNTKLSNRFGWVSLIFKESDWNYGKVFLSLMFMAYEEKLSFIRIKFKFVGSHAVLNEEKALL